MRIIAENDAISKYSSRSNKAVSDEELIDFIDKHKDQEIHILLDGVSGSAFDEFFIHNNIAQLKQFKNCNITFEYERSTGTTDSQFMDDYKNNHIEGQRADGNKVFSINQIIEDEDFVLKIANEINSKNFSPLEKIFAIYNITTSMKSYHKESPSSGLEQSRSLFEYLNNNYMVCAGYKNFLENICYLTDIPSCYEFVRQENEPHARLYVNITDEKYGINGYYVLDPTADISKGINFASRSLKHFLMTTSNANLNIEYTWLDVLNYKNIDNFKENYTNSTKEYLLSVFEALDKDFVEKFKSLDLTNNHDIQILLNYLNTKLDNEIETDKIHQAKSVVASSIFKLPENTNIEDFLYAPKQNDMTEKEFEFMQSQGYEDKSFDSKESQLIDRLSFLYNIMFNAAFNDFKTNNVTIDESGPYPNSKIFNEASEISLSFERKLQSMIQSAENPEEFLTTLKENGFFIDKNGRLDTDKKFDQILESAEKAAINKTTPKEKSEQISAEFVASYQNLDLETSDLKKSILTIANTLEFDKSPNSNTREDDSYEH